MHATLTLSDALALLPYDSSVGDGLKKIAEEAGDIEPMTHAQVSALHDNDFALVYQTKTGQVRAYPIHTADQARMALSEFDTFGQFVAPDETVKTAGGHIINACDRFDVPVPEHLNSFRQPDLISNVAPAPYEMEAKVAQDEDVSHFAYATENVKRYPINTVEQVKAACAYFESDFNSFPPGVRHIYASNVAQRATKLGVDASESIQKWAQEGLSPYAPMGLLRRLRLATEPSHKSKLADLHEKIAGYQESPQRFAEELYDVDVRYGHFSLYKAGMPDPWMTAHYRPFVESDEPSEDEVKVAAAVRAIAVGTTLDQLTKEAIDRLLDQADGQADVLDPVARSVIDRIGK